MSKRILKLVQSDDLRRSKSDKLIAHYIERNIAELPFETARSIAQRLQVSPMTIGRYLRRMGFDGLDELKSELRRGGSNPAWEVKAQVASLEQDRKEGKLLAGLIQQQIDNLGQIYAITSAPEW